ncbi:MAG: branched-chain amino acid transaminase [Vampirovibrionia bacterium]
MADNTLYVYMNGQYVPNENATINVRTHALMYGTSVFEGIRGYWNEEERRIYIFRMKEHYERLGRSCKIMHMEMPHTPDELCDITVELIKKNKPTTDTYIRPSIYKCGETIGPKLIDNPDGTIIFTTPLGQYVDISKGLNVCISSWRRIIDSSIPPRAKVGGSYCNAALIKTEAILSGFDEAITLTNDNKVNEGSAMNLFIVREGKLVTSTRTDDILEGITRDTIIKMAHDLNIEVEERRIDRTELYICEEAFFCGTGAQVAPVTKVDHREVGEGKPGPIAKKLQDLYFDIVRGKVEKYKHWCVAVDID